MKKTIRIIPKLDIKNGLLIKGINLEGLRILGNPFEFAKFYYENGADEISYIDNVATLYGTENKLKFVSSTAKNLFIPLMVGGGINNLKMIEKMLKLGADKVNINSAAVHNNSLIKESARFFGSSTICITIEAVKIGKKYFISTSNGRDIVEKNPIDWAKKIEDLGAGEIFLTSVNNEGLMKGFDVDIIKKISNTVKIPVIAHGGAGNFEHIYDVINKTNISAVSLSGILHYEACNYFKFKKKIIGNTFFLEKQRYQKKRDNLILRLKKFLKKKKINVRL
jgi:imidazole glycerol-phosphate synthase subunit HisF